MKVVIANDTAAHSPTHFGCLLTMEAMRDQLERIGADVIDSISMRERSADGYRAHADALSSADLVIVNGEGSLHDGNRSDLYELATAYPSVLVNASWFRNAGSTVAELVQHFRFVTCRDVASQAELRAAGVEAEVVPDLVFAAPTLRGYSVPEGQPSVSIGVGDSSVPGSSGFGVSVREPSRYLDTLSQYETVVTGRLHAVIACSVLGIRFIAYQGNTPKVRALLSDMESLHLYRDTQEHALALATEGGALRLPEHARRHVAEAPDRIADSFLRLPEFAG